MRTTRAGPIPEFIGASVFAGTIARWSPVEVCGISRENTRLTASFWDWKWDGEGLDEIVSELRGSRCAMLIGPQGYAAPGRVRRACERLAAAAERTPDSRDKIVRGLPSAEFILRSLHLFAAIQAHGVRISPPEIAGGVGEVYPAHLWRLLSTMPGNKRVDIGMTERHALLTTCGVHLPAISVTHDMLDAAIAALVAAAACGAVPGLTTRHLGDPLVRRPDGTLEEGPMVVLDVTEELQDKLRRAVAV